jgi:hypothetical protein
MKEYRRWEDNIKMVHKAIGVGCDELAQDRDHCRTLVNVALNLQII